MGSTVADCADSDNGASDVDGDFCWEYRANWCGGYDDHDFFANTMCCICGGGIGGGVLATASTADSGVTLVALGA